MVSGTSSLLIITLRMVIEIGMKMGSYLLVFVDA